MTENNMDILNTEEEGKKKFFDKNGKTTLKNLRLLRSEREVDDVLFLMGLLKPSSILGFFSVDEITEYLMNDMKYKHQEILEWLNRKHFWKDTGENIDKNEEFIKEHFNYNYSLITFIRNLRELKFKAKEVSNYYSIMENLNKEMEKH